MKKYKIKFLFLNLFITILSFTFILSNNNVVNGAVSNSYDKVNVLSDIYDMSFGGVKFNLDNYKADKNKDTEVLTFMEYCYSNNLNDLDKYNLYLYLYNPKQIELNYYNELNNISISYGYNANNYKKVKLIFCNTAEDMLFIKFKLDIQDDKKVIYDKLFTECREYRLGELEFYDIDNQIYTVDVGSTFKFSGYAKGINGNTESTLQVTSDRLKTLSLKTYDTFFRPDGTSKDKYTQDTLHSVYFSVSNEILNTYGGISKIHAEWLKARLKPFLVISDVDAYNVLKNYVGKNYIGSEENIRVVGGYEVLPTDGGSGNLKYWNFSYSPYNSPTSFPFNGLVERKGYDIDVLYGLFYSENSDAYTLTSEEILNFMRDSKYKFGGELVLDKYSKSIFESVDSEFTDVNISIEDKYNFSAETITYKNLWQKFWGIETIISEEYQNISAIYKVQEEDLVGTDEEISKRIYIAKDDVSSFRTFYQKAQKNNESVYLFRFDTTDYISQEANVQEYSLLGWNHGDTNASFRQGYVHLNFDIIDITFRSGDKETIVPVLHTPVDLVADFTPPVYITDDFYIPKYVWWLVAGIGLCLIGFILTFNKKSR